MMGGVTRLAFALIVLGLAEIVHTVWATGASSDVVGARIVRLDRRIDALVPPDAKLEKIADGFAWVEGPAWSRRDGSLVFSDIPNNAVMRWRPDAGVSVFLARSGYTGTAPFAGREPGSNGLAFDREGRLVLCEHGNRRITRLDADGRRRVLADRYDGRRPGRGHPTA